MAGKSIATIVLLSLLLVPENGVKGQVVFRKIADTAMPIPGGTGNFTSFDAPAIAYQYFHGSGSGGQEGIYFPTDVGLIKIVDLTSSVPGGSGSFTQFGHVTGGGAFNAAGGGRIGLYRGAQLPSSVPIAGAVLVADNNTVAPSGGTFTQFGQLARDSIYSPTAFRAVTTTGTGIYFAPQVGPIATIVKVGDSVTGGTITELSDPQFHGGGFGYGLMGVATRSDGVRLLFNSFGAAPNYFAQLPASIDIQQFSFGRSRGFGYVGSNGGTKGVHYFANFSDSVVAKLGDPIPGGIGGFADFDSLSVTDPNLGYPAATLSFRGLGSSGQVGIYYTPASVNYLYELISRGDMLDGKTIADLAMSPDGMEDIGIAFRATFTDGSIGIYVASIPEPSSALLAVLFISHAAGRRRRL